MSLKRNWYPGGTSAPSSGGSGLPAGANGALDCTAECRARDHALLVLSSACLGNLKLLRHCASVCANPVYIRDELGRTALHVATSRGHLQLVQWLLARRKKVKVDLADWESKWTALHRSAYYGQLGAAALLLKHGADVKASDEDGWSPLDILNADRKYLKQVLNVAAINVHTWGRNPNDTLGHDRSRKHPERLELTLAPTDTITKVVLCKFHSVFLSKEGRVLTCGHGPGGRLGHNTEQSIVTPRVVKAMERMVCVGVAAARDHTVILTKGGLVYTCGLNDAHQLGQGSNPTSAPSNCLAPKLVKGLKNRQVIGVGAGRYHTAMCTVSELYTVGKNLGQLGYEKTHDTQVAPHAVAGINLDSDEITRMSASDSATAVLTRKRHAFVCTGFIVKHIRLGFLDKASCLQFEVCASLSDRDYLRKVETEPTKLVLLDSEHRLWVWEPTKRGYPTTIRGFARHNVTQFSLGKCLTVVTEEGQVFTGGASTSKPLNLQRLPGIQNAQAVFTDFKANNFAYIQNVYGSPFLPALSPSTLTSDLSFLLEESSLPGSVSDITIEAGGQVFDAHKYILGSQSQDFVTQLIPSDGPFPSTFKLRKKCDNPDVFEAFLHYIYGSHLRLIPPSNGQSQLHPPPPLLRPVTNGMGSDSTWDAGEGPESSTANTSLASLDDNDLTEEYDKYCSNGDEFQEDFIEVEIQSLQSPVVVGQSTPRKKSFSLSHSSSHRDSVGGGWDGLGGHEPEKVLLLENRRLDARSLLQLAVNFDLTHLKKALEEVMPHLHKPRTIPRRPRLRLRRMQEFSDLALISKEGKAVHCHRCVLVARSEYFRSMLLMGWKESSDDLTSLSMPVGHKVLKAVIDFIYTDEIQILKGGDMVEWMMAVLVMADQLLLTRLKELCEYALAKILDLRNAVEFLEFAEAYSAQQLKRACLEFICVNGAHFLEARSLDSVDVTLLGALSATYKDLVLPNTKRVIKFPELSLEQLPESYFRDDQEEAAMLDSGGDESEGELDRQTTPTPDLPDTPTHTPSSGHANISPRAVSNSRRKRKRKSSQSDKKGRSPPPPTSPVEEKSIMLRANPSPANPASPDSITSPCSPVSALASDWVPTTITRSLSTGNTGGGRSKKAQDAPHDSLSSPPTQWVSIDRRRKNSNLCDSSAIMIPKCPDLTDESVLKPRANSVPTACHLQGAEQRHAQLPATPLSVPNKASSRGKKTKAETRMRLLNKFNTAMTEESGMQGHVEEITPPESQQKSPLVKDMGPRGPWGGPVNGCMEVSGTKSLRDIMAREQEIQQKAKQHSRPPPAQSVALNSDGRDGGPGRITRSRSQPVPVVKVAQKENLVPSPSNASPSPGSGNPWKTSESFSPAVSMRALIAEAEAEDKHSKMQALANKPMKKACGEAKPSKRQPVIQPHQQVSFASIIKSQESELNRRPAQKALALIQIEEHAMSELEKAYGAQDNPDEVIVIERCPKTSPQVDPQGPVNSPWGL